ncbi:reverse transcriptase domain-containing protein [Tanacetum coccineum]
MCCDDAYHVTSRVSALAMCDRLVSEPLVIEERFVFFLFFVFYFDLRATRYQKIQKRSQLRRSLSRTKGGRVVEESEKKVDSDLLSDARSRPGPAKSGDRVICCDMCDHDKDGYIVTGILLLPDERLESQSLFEARIGVAEGGEVENKKYLSGVEQEEAFQNLKENLCNAPILSLPDGAEDFVVYCDASNQGLGCVLMQRGKVIAYASRQLKIHKKNYIAHDLELDAVHIFNQKELNMRQRRWIELFSDYDYEIRYHPGMKNVVVDALSRKERVKPKRVRAMSMTIQSSIKERLMAAQNEAIKEEGAPTEMLCSLDQQMEKKGDGGLYFMDRIWVPLIGNVRTMIMDEAHTTRYFIHPGADKMYYDLRDMYWWPGMKGDIATYVSKCLTCSKVKAGHQRPLGLLQQSEIPDWKWDKITMDFITKLPSMKKLSRLYIDEIVAWHGVHVSIISDQDGKFASRFWRSLHKALGTRLDMSTVYHPQTDGQSECTIQTLKDMLRASPVLWAEIGEFRSIGTKLVQETTNKVILIKEKLKAARDCQKGYVGNRRKHLELKLEYWTDANMHVPLEEIKVHKTLRFIEEPAEIIDRGVKSLKRSRISIVKFCWNLKRDYEDFMKTKYPHLLIEQVIVGNTN